MIFAFNIPLYKGGLRGIFMTFYKISPNPSLEKRGALWSKSKKLNRNQVLKIW